MGWRSRRRKALSFEAFELIAYRQSNSKVSSAPSKGYQPRKKLSLPKQQDVNVAQMTLPVTRAPSKEKVVIKQIRYGVFESKKCDFCGLLPTNHYCKVPCPGSMTSLEGSESREICGKVPCMNCRSK